jgi:hypothetical protein
MRDGGRPSEGGLQDQPSNCPALRGDKIPGGERTGKGEKNSSGVDHGNLALRCNGRNPMGSTREGQSTDAERRDGSARSSDETR